MWLFESPKNYTEMCKKISQSVFYITLIELFVLSQISNDFADFMKKMSFNTETEIANIKLYVAYIYVPIALSILENIFRLHDKIGKMFDLRGRYDGNVLFKAYITKLKVDIPETIESTSKAYRKNKSLQKSIANHFYYYVSDTNPKIDEHCIHMALDSWCWVWIFLDNIGVTLLLCVIAIIMKICSWIISWWLVIGLLIYSAVLAVLLVALLKTSCKKYTCEEVSAAVKMAKQDNTNNNEKLKREIENALQNQ